MNPDPSQHTVQPFNLFIPLEQLNSKEGSGKLAIRTLIERKAGRPPTRFLVRERENSQKFINRFAIFLFLGNDGVNRRARLPQIHAE
jgi:hypothetical protein